MTRRQKEVELVHLRNERGTLKALEIHYSEALADIKQKLLILQADLTSQSKIYQIAYQQQLEKQLSMIVDRLRNSNFNTVQEYLHDCYVNGFVGTMYDLQGQGIPLTLPINQEQVLRAVQKTGDDFKLVNKLGVPTNQLKNRVQTELTRGLASGLSYVDIARNISNYGLSDMKRSMNIAQTEGHRLQSESKFDSLRAAKAKGADVIKQWDSTLDGKTRDTHRMLDGQIKEIDEDFTVSGKSAPYPGGFGDPAEDCRCRCIMLQRARWAVSGESTYPKWNNEHGGIIECTGYEDFKKKYLDAVSDSDNFVANVNSEFYQKFGNDHYRNMHELIMDSPEKAQKLWDKMEGELRVNDAHSKEHPHFNTRNGITLDVDRDAAGSNWQKPYQTSFHEFGHNIDYVANRDFGNGYNHQPYSYTYHDNQFGQTIRNEVQNRVNAVNSALRAEFKEHAGDFAWLHDNGYIGDFDYNWFTEHGTWLTGEPKYTKARAYDFIEKELREIPSMRRAAISDIMEGATNGKINAGFGHGNSYWKRETALPAETFAEMIESLYTNPEQLEVLKQYLPESYQLFEEMVDSIVKG